MTRSPDGAEQNPDWRRIALNDQLYRDPKSDELAGPLAAPSPSHLNLNDLPWQTFERLLLRVSRSIDGALDVHLYGKPGQKQHGIDLVGFFLDGPTTVYQAKDWKEFTAGDLSGAVKKYADGKRPFDATRLVVAVACDTSDTKVVDKLADLRIAYPGLTIELWGRNRLSELLEPYPDIVARFFGSATAKLFCSGLNALRDETPPPKIESDAILRGPLASLNLLAEMAEAERLVDESPRQAAALYGSIAEKLEQSPFQAHASRVRERQAAALESSGEHEIAAGIRLSLGWQFVHAGDQWSAGRQVAEMEKHEQALGEATARSGVALARAAEFGYARSVKLDDVAATFDDLRPGDSHEVNSALLLAEQAVAWRRLDLIKARAARLRTLADGLPLDDDNQTTAARLRMCLADAVDDWPQFTRHARASYRPALRAWVHARHARHLAMTGWPEQAIEAWENSAADATNAGFYSDAGDWLYAARTVHSFYGRIFGIDLNEYHRRAQALRATSNNSQLPTPSPLRQQVLSRILAEKWQGDPQSLFVQVDGVRRGAGGWGRWWCEDPGPAAVSSL